MTAERSLNDLGKPLTLLDLSKSHFINKPFELICLTSTGKGPGVEYLLLICFDGEADWKTCLLSKWLVSKSPAEAKDAAGNKFKFILDPEDPDEDTIAIARAH